VLEVKYLKVAKNSKDNGYMSIEVINDQHYAIQRSYAGQLLFKGLILSKMSLCKLTNMESNDANSKGSECVKLRAFVLDSSSKKY
jgi:hypothetical protein